MAVLLFFLVLPVLFVTACEEKKESEQPSAAAAAEEPLYTHFLSVGKGDCILLEQAGRCLMIDTGHGEDMEHISGYLDALGVTRLDVLMLSHMHADHIGSAAGLLETYGADVVWMRDHEMDSSAYSKWKKVLEKNSVPVVCPEPGEQFSWQDCQFTVLGPLKDYEEYNDQSMVVYMEFAGHGYLFTGDMEEEAERDLLEAYKDLLADVDVLKAGHHGKNSSSKEEFLQVVRPEIAVVCCGAEDGDEGPGEKAVARLTRYASCVYRTDEGDVVLTDDGLEIRASVEKHEVLPVREWIGNVKTGVYHRLDCNGLPAVRNRCYFAAAEAAEAAGYRPCGNCLR